MKRAVGMAILGTLLLGSAHAAESGVTAVPGNGKDSVTQSAPSATKKSQLLQGKKAKPAGKKAGVKKIDKKEKKLNSLTETPGESTDQSVLIKGVRG